VAPLAKREADVARLVAEGLSNKQIGARLFISERTVDSHVRNILNKLGFNSRAQIAGWMASSNQ
jgi:DNA-binding NarL/FixJ family response regulator